MKSSQKLPAVRRSIVTTGMPLARACANAGCRPVESFGATISASAPWLIMLSMSATCLAWFALAFV